MTKPGWKTTEFWLAAAAAFVGALIATGAVTGTWQAVLGAVASALAAVGYSTSRTAVKTAESKGAAPRP